MAKLRNVRRKGRGEATRGGAVEEAPTSGKRPQAEALGPGIHGAFIELQSAENLWIRTTDGRRLPALLGDGVDPALADDCLRHGRMVIVTQTPRGVTIMGALQTAAAPVVRDEHGRVTLEGRELRLLADEAVSLEVGCARLSAEDNGKVRIEGDKLVIDMAALVRIFSNQVELP